VGVSYGLPKPQDPTQKIKFCGDFIRSAEIKDSLQVCSKKLEDKLKAPGNEDEKGACLTHCIMDNMNLIENGKLDAEKHQQILKEAAKTAGHGDDDQEANAVIEEIGKCDREHLAAITSQDGQCGEEFKRYMKCIHDNVYIKVCHPELPKQT